MKPVKNSDKGGGLSPSRTFLQQIDNTINALTVLLQYVACFAVFAMMMLTTLDVVLRFFRMPIPGTYELVAQLGAIAVAFGLANTTAVRGHVAVSIIISRFPRRVRNILDTITSLLGFSLFALASFEVFKMAGQYRQSGHVSATLEMPLFPIVYGIGFSLAVVCLVLLSSAVKQGGKALGKW